MLLHEFNSFTGRLKESTQFQPLYPLKPSALNKTEPPKMIWDTIKTKPVKATKTTAPSATFSSSVDPKLLKLYEHFQKDIHKPVYLMGGTRDKVLFGITLLLLSINSIQAIEFIYTASKKL